MEFFAGTETDTIYPFDNREYWVSVKRELTAGEDRAIAHAALRKGTREVAQDGVVSGEVGFVIDLDRAAFTKVALWMHDWNIPDASKKPVDVSSEQKKFHALRALKPEVFRQIEVALDAYVAEKEAEKKVPAGRTGSGEPS